MSTEQGLQIFKSDEFGELRIVEKEGEPWFVASDVAKMLELSDIHLQIRGLNKDEADRYTITTSSQRREMTIVSESGLYKLIFQSRKPEAKKVIDWVTREVMPSIRKHGAYMTPQTAVDLLKDPRNLIKLLTEFAETQDRLAVAEEKIAIDKPKVEVAEALDSAVETFTVGEASKMIQQAGYTEHGQNFLYGFLRENGLVMKVGCAPTQRAIKAGWLKEHVTFWEDRQGATHPTISSRVTGKGMSYLLDVFRKLHEAEQARAQHQGSLVERKKKPFSLKKMTEAEYRQLQ